MNDRRKQLLASKQTEMTTAVERWADEQGILRLDEEIIVKLHVRAVKTRRKKHLLDESDIAARQRMLPPDDPVSFAARAIWRLDEEDWRKLARLRWSEPQATFLALLHRYHNSPLQSSEVVAHGIEWNTLFLRQFNAVLREASDYRTNSENGAYYLLTQLPKSSYYAIRKQQRCSNNST